jgi:hypothetical protein
MKMANWAETRSVYLQKEARTATEAVRGQKKCAKK